MLNSEKTHVSFFSVAIPTTSTSSTQFSKRLQPNKAYLLKVDKFTPHTKARSHNISQITIEPLAHSHAWE